jgi:CubicO group peptidase (beta-lactamase class C family)
MRSPACPAALAGLLAAMTATLASAQPATLRLDELIAGRIQGDRSNVCLHAARIDLAATPSVVSASGCAGPRTDAPAIDARFEIGSISKAFVGVLAAEMVARGELKLDEPLSALLPPGASAPRAGEQEIRVIDLLTHMSGLPPLPPTLGPGADPANPYARLRADVLYDPLRGVTLAAAPGTRYAYSNWAFLMLSDLLSRRAGTPYDRLLTERVLAPLGLNDTRVARNDGLVPGRMANGQPTPAWDVPAQFAGAGGLRAPLGDLVTFARALMGELPESAPASLRSALAASIQRQREINSALSIGLAWHLRARGGGAQEAPLVFHNGMTGGFSSMLLIDVAQRRAAVVLADAAGGFDDLALHLLDARTPLASPRRAVALDLPAARNALGRYELAPGFILTLAIDAGVLYAQATGQDRFELKQDSRGDYYARVADILVRMDRDSTGRATGLTLFQGGGAMRAKRLGD